MRLRGRPSASPAWSAWGELYDARIRAAAHTSAVRQAMRWAQRQNRSRSFRSQVGTIGERLAVAGVETAGDGLFEAVSFVKVRQGRSLRRSWVSRTWTVLGGAGLSEVHSQRRVHSASSNRACAKAEPEAPGAAEDGRASSDVGTSQHPQALAHCRISGVSIWHASAERAKAAEATSAANTKPFLRIACATFSRARYEYLRVT